MAPRLSIGEILVRRGVLTRADVDRALRAQAQLLLPLASTVLRMGIADEPALVAALGEHFGVPGLDLSGSVLATEAVSSVPRDLARAHHLLPVARDDTTLQLVIANPSRQDVLEELAFATGRTSVPFACLQMRIDETIDAMYEARAAGQALWSGSRAEAETAHLEILVPEPQPDDVSMDEDIPEASLQEIVEVRAELRRPAGSPPVVLVVDDEVEILDLIERALGSIKIEVVRATRGGEVMELVESAQPDAVLLDAMLPEVKGFDLCERIKKSPRFRHVPVIIISAMASGWNFAQDVKRLYGADGYIAKPFRVAHLIREVEELLERTKARPLSPDLDHAVRLSARECRRAAELYKSGSLDEALDAANRAVEADPFDPRAHFVLGTVLNARGDVYPAIAQYERVAELAPSLFSALKNLAVLYERQGFKARAVEMWMRALEQSPNDAVRQTIKAHLFGLI